MIESLSASSVSTSIGQLVLGAVAGQARELSTIYDLVDAIRPGLKKTSVRARVYENVEKGRIHRVAQGVFVGLTDAGRLVLVEGNTWELMSQMPDGAFNLLITDPPFDMGTAQNAKVGTTRPHMDKGRQYEQRDLDAAWFREAYRVVSKAHTWNTIAPRLCATCNGKVDKMKVTGPGLGHCDACGTTVALKPRKFPVGGGGLVILTPPRNELTDPHIDRMKLLAKEAGFVFQAEFAVDYTDKGMGYWPPQRHWLLHFFTAGERAGVPWDLTLTSCFTVKRVKRASKEGAKEHEAEKPEEVFLRLIRFITQANDVVFDCFAGRARWHKQALAEGRHVVLIEKDPTWVRRIADEDWGGTQECSSVSAA